MNDILLRVLGYVNLDKKCYVSLPVNAVLNPLPPSDAIRRQKN